MDDRGHFPVTIQGGNISSDSDNGSPISNVESSTTLDTNDNGNGHDHPSITIIPDYVVENSDVEQNRN